MNILVTGGAGYIGSHMCKRLAEHGHRIAVIDDLSTGHEQAVRWGEFHRGDVGDGEFLDRVFERFRPEAVLHFAAKSIVAESVADPALYYRTNVAGSLRLIERVRKTPGCVFVLSSTAAIFGRPQAERIDETHPCAPINAYGRSKLMVENILAEYWAAYRLPSVSLRYFNAAGADASGAIGEAHTPETHLIPRILEAALGRAEPVRVFGADYDTRDGTCIRDYIHVDDLCQAHLDGLEYLRAHPGCHAFNLGNGRGFTVREVLDAATRVVGRRLAYQIGERRPGDPAMLVADAARAQQILHWRPAHPQLETLIESAWRWHRQRAF
ncbi:MAG: UDP-glucose 4-epimerase GalE [Nevskia sp.]|nr:UDP-glucose 4-epimerase GalE [Nevskia sp.]